MCSSKQSGITLVEIVISLAVISLMATVVGSFARNTFYYNTVTKGSLTTAQDARAILRTITTELRSSAPSSNGAYPIISAGTSSVSFYSDPNGDGVRDQIRYYVSSGKLYRGIITPTGSPLVYSTSTEKISVLAGSIRNTASTTVFTYYDGTYNGTASTTALVQPVSVTMIRLIKVALILDVDQNNLPISRTYTSQVTLRNLKDNL